MLVVKLLSILNEDRSSCCQIKTNASEYASDNLVIATFAFSRNSGGVHDSSDYEA